MDMRGPATVPAWIYGSELYLPVTVGHLVAP